MLVSSANIINFNRVDTLQMSLIYRINNNGPWTEAWGTPQRTFAHLDDRSYSKHIVF